LDDVNNFRSFFQKSKSLTAVGLGNLISNAISSIFWLYIASVLGKEGYGELGYLLATVGTAGAFALLGSNSTLPVYVAKGVKIQATVFFITLVAGVVASVILLGITQNIFASFYPLAFVVFSVIVYDYLGRKAFVNYAKYMIIQRILMVIF
jgi:O-antigen/teichoic acid export membrane protein